MAVGATLFVLFLMYLFFTDRGGCGCLLILLVLMGAITIV